MGCGRIFNPKKVVVTLFLLLWGGGGVLSSCCVFVCVMKKNGVGEFIDFELAEDTKSLIKNNKDVKVIDKELLNKIMDCDDDVLVRVTKFIGYGVVISSFDVVTGENSWW